MWKPEITHKDDDFLLNIVQYIVQWICGGLSACIVGGLAMWWLAPIAYEQRGYHAVGGEGVLVLVVAFVAFQVGKLLHGKRI